MKVVIDADVMVSALLTQEGAPKQIIDLWRAGKFTLLMTAEIIAEISRVVRYPKIAALHQLTEEELIEFIALLTQESMLVKPTERLSASLDESDNRYLECAAAGAADFLITGDKKHLLPLNIHRGTRIVAPASFIVIIRMSD